MLTIYGQSLNSKKDTEQLTQTITKKNKNIDELIQGKNELIKGSELLVAQNIKLLVGNDELNMKLDDYQNQILEKDYQINELKEKVTQAKFGVNKRYSYEGVISPSGADGMIRMTDDAPSIFRQLSGLEKTNTSESFQQIINLCNVQIKQKPDWYTLYLFRGMALAKLGKKEEAIIDFNYVIDNGPNDYKYRGPAKYFLKELKK